MLLRSDNFDFSLLKRSEFVFVDFILKHVSKYEFKFDIFFPNKKQNIVYVSYLNTLVNVNLSSIFYTDLKDTKHTFSNTKKNLCFFISKIGQTFLLKIIFNV